MKTKTRVFLIHGGATFRNRKDYLHFLRTRKVSLAKKVSWSGDYLDKELGKDFEIVRLRMPSPDNAKYEEWKICFERYLPYINRNTILIGSSLGGIFLAKYLPENKLRQKVLSTYLVKPPFDGSGSPDALVGGFKLGPDLSLLEKNSKNLYLLFSEDDDVVPVAHATKYAKKLWQANILIFKNKNGHFKVPRFPEIIKMIKGDVNRKNV